MPIAVLASENPSDLTYIPASALLDTGATSSGIGPQVIQKLGLMSYEKRPLSVATELRMVDYFLFRVGFLDLELQDNNNPTQIPFVFAETDGFGWSEPRSFEVILGMDVLKQCDFHLDRNGNWKLIF